MGLKSYIRSIMQIIKEEKKVPIEHRVTEKNEFNGKVALITGGTGGIGFAIAKSLLESGCKVIISGTSEKKLAGILNELNNENVSSIIMNYTEPEEFGAKVTEAANIFGRLDIFVSSVGVHTENVNFWEMTPKEFNRVMDINLKGVFFCMSNCW